MSNFRGAVNVAFLLLCAMASTSAFTASFDRSFVTTTQLASSKADDSSAIAALKVEVCCEKF
jgi:hypothetical protein